VSVAVTLSPRLSAADVQQTMDSDQELTNRFNAVKKFASSVRASEYHLTNACNIRCKGCWFFEYDFDKATKDERDPDLLREFVIKERERGINAPLIIGGEPTLFPDRIATYVEEMQRVTISTNGLKPLPRSGFEDVSIAVSLFGGGALDDELRAIRPNGKTFNGLFDTALDNYRHDQRVWFVFALTELGIDHIEETVRKISDNGNVVVFNFYSQYDTSDPLAATQAEQLLAEALRVKALYPKTVLSTPYYINTMVTGKSHWGEFGYGVCPSISIDHEAHKERLENGNRSLPLFNAWAPDLETIQFCCTSGHCESCRDSQAVMSWLMVSPNKFLESPEMMRTWTETAEGYWSQFIWSPFHRRQRIGKLLDETTAAA
jgi:MoaA/NifB/PqqE/SkfB family radical SAM enzyme